MNDWQAHIADDFDPFTQRVVIYRRWGDDTTEIVTGFDANGSPVVTRLERNPATGGVGIRLPIGALDAIAEAVKPGPSRAELAVTREWLDTERERVERLIDSALERP